MSWAKRRVQATAPAAALAAVLIGGLSVGAAAADWPQWRGPDRTDVTPEASGHPAGWPPAKLWSRNVGEGCTSPIIVAGRLYVMGWQGGGGRRGRRGATGTDALFCLDAASGRELWRQTYPSRYQGRVRTGDTGAYGGPSSTPTFDRETALLYTLGIDGDLRCWDTKRSGRLVWAVNFHEKYRIRQRPDVGGGRRDYGHTSAPLIHGNLLYVEVSSTEGAVMAFDKRTGRRVWASEYRDHGGHSGGPVLMKVAGIDCLANLALSRLVVMRVDRGHEGKTLATVPWTTDFANNIPTPAVAGSRIVVTSSYNVSRTALIEVSRGAARQKWTTRRHAKVCSPVIYKGRVFMVDGPLKCLDLATGSSLWRGGSFGHGSCLVAAGDDKVLVFGRGQLVLAEALGSSYRELSRVKGIVRGTCYPHVCLSDGMICCKDRSGSMVAFSVRPSGRKAVAKAHPPARAKPSREARPPSRGPGPAAGRPKSQTDKLHDAAAPKMAGAWPGNREGLVFLWAGAGGANRITDAAGRTVRTCRLAPRGKAKTNPRGAMDLTGGAMLAQGAEAALLNACRKSHQLGLEARIAPANLRQGGPARIISFSTDPYHRNFTLGQEGDRLILRLRTPRTGPNGSNPEVRLCRLAAGRTHHVIVSYSPGRLTCYLDGKRVLDTAAVGGDFRNWSDQHLLFGDEWRGSRDWAGTLDHVAIHSRVIGADEAARRWKLAVGSPAK